MTPEERIEAIRERQRMPSEMHKSEIWDDANWLLQRLLTVMRENAALRAVVAVEMPEPLVHRSSQLPPWCAYCRLDTRHAPDCPWLLRQAALRALGEVAG